jgi:hypothetical protein
VAILPVEGDTYPKVADALNAALQDVSVPSAQTAIHSKVSLETVQLQIECIDPTPACYSQVGKQFHAAQVLFASVDQGSGGSGVAITVELFDVSSGKAAGTATGNYSDEDSAAAAAASLVKQAAGG